MKKTLITLATLLLTVLLATFGFLKYFKAEYNITSIFDLGPNAASSVIMTISFIVIVLILSGILFYSIFTLNSNRHTLELQFKLNKRNQEYMEVFAKNIIEKQRKEDAQNIIRSMDYIFYNLSDMLIEIILRADLADEGIISRILDENIDLRIWALSQIVVNRKKNAKDFNNKIKQLIKEDDELKAYIERYVERYDKYLKILKRVDENKLITPFFEEGSLGKVYSVLSEVK